VAERRGTSRPRGPMDGSRGSEAGITGACAQSFRAPPSQCRKRGDDSRCSRVPMMWRPHLRGRNDPATARRLDRAGNRRLSTQGQAGSRLVVLREAGGQEPHQTGFAEHDHVIQTVAADRADRPARLRDAPSTSATSSCQALGQCALDGYGIGTVVSIGVTMLSLPTVVTNSPAT
jgi:hypothetical protein